ncbi:MAG: hypothetical protein NTW34_05855 [Actinobacteria bacterium]|nr:hypothetical protein [Actinomycetota bacterium]
MKLRTIVFSTTVLILGAGCSSDSAATPSTDGVTTEVPSSDAPATDGARVVFGFTVLTSREHLWRMPTYQVPTCQVRT